MTGPPLQLSVDVAAPDGSTHNRWAFDEPDPENVPSALTFSSTMPGGFEQAGLTLPRQPGLDYSDLTEFSKVTILGAGGEIAWQGRLETMPRTSGAQLSITPGITGYQAALADNNAAREIYIDCALTQWGSSSAQLKINDATAAQDVDDPTTVADGTTGQPSIATQFSGAWTRTHACKAWYDAAAVPIGTLYYAWKISPNVIYTDTNWVWQTWLSNDDVQTGLQGSSPLRSAGPGTGSLVANDNAKRFAMVYLAYSGAGGTQQTIYSVYWTYLGVVGRTVSPSAGHSHQPAGSACYASDVIAHAVGKYAPGLALVDSGGASTITPTNFVIPQLAFTDPTTAAAIITRPPATGSRTGGSMRSMGAPRFISRRATVMAATGRRASDRPGCRRPARPSTRSTTAPSSPTPTCPGSSGPSARRARARTSPTPPSTTQTRRTPRRPPASPAMRHRSKSG